MTRTLALATIRWHLARAAELRRDGLTYGNARRWFAEHLQAAGAVRRWVAAYGRIAA